MLQGAATSSKAKSMQSLQALEAQVVQLQSRLAYMEEEKGRLVAAAKGKNEQVMITTSSHDCKAYSEHLHPVSCAATLT